MALEAVCTTPHFLHS